MHIDPSYEIRLREMSDLNAAANKLLHEASAILRSADDTNEEE